MGKSSGNVQAPNTQAVDEYGRAAARIAEQLYGTTQGVRGAVTNQFTEMMGGTQSPVGGNPLADTPYNTGAGNWQQFSGGGFDGAAYLAANPDVAQDPVFAANPYLHYTRHGRSEGRSLGLPTTTPVVTPATTPDPALSPGGPVGVREFSDVQAALNPFIENADIYTAHPDNPALYGGAKAALEEQYRIARENAMSMLPTGGSLNAGLVGLEGGRAYGLSQIMAELASQDAAAQERGLDRAIGVGGAQVDINQRQIDRALQLASGGTAGALQGFSVGGNLASNAAGIQAGMYSAQQARQGAAKQGMGQAAGQIGAAAVKKCWVAREVYGETDPRWLLFREWLENSGPRWLDKTYTNHGESFAAFIRNKPRLKSIIRYFMDRVIYGC